MDLFDLTFYLINEVFKEVKKSTEKDWKCFKEVKSQTQLFVKKRSGYTKREYKLTEETWMRFFAVCAIMCFPEKSISSYWHTKDPALEHNFIKALMGRSNFQHIFTFIASETPT